jgi:epoxide hydrolase-like predicted phosphatase
VSPTPIKTIFWDIGGVLLTNGWDSRQRAHVLPGLGVDLIAYEAVHDEVNYYWERGLMSAQDFFQRTVIATNPDPNLTFERLWPLVCGESKVLHQESFDILAALKSSGQYRLATINNESKELNAYRLDTFQLRQYFDYFICSGYVHEMKPSPEIYRAAIDISGLPPETALFIDDRQENCEAARAFGMNAIHFESPAQLRASLTQLGIAV